MNDIFLHTFHPLYEAAIPPLHIPGAFLVGSYLVNPETANDIDIVIPWSVQQVDTSGVLSSYNVTSRDDPEYDRSDVSCLIHTMRSPCRKINILIVADEYIAAYKAAVAHCLRHPEEHSTRPRRVDIYHYYEMQVKKMIQANPIG